jgi:predicted pyridoxine 5'-phosphate oxidase superfamily flavin-nucleotide-binding protein
VLSPKRLGFTDFGGNRQYVSVGNIAHDDRAALIVMDQAGRQRLKLFGHLRFLDREATPREIAQAVALPDYRARMERVGIIEVVAFDWNCPQHIAQRFTLEEIEEATRPLRQRIAELEAQLGAAKV